MIRLRLRTRLTIWFAASILIILAPLLSIVLVFEWRSLRAGLDHHLQEDLEVAAEMLVFDAGAVTWRTPSSLDFGYDAGLQRWVEVFDEDGQVLFLRGFAAHPGIRSALDGRSLATRGYRTLQTPAGAYVRTLTERRTFDASRVWLRVARSEDDLRGQFRALLWLFAFGAPLAVGVAAAAGYWLSGRALAPLARMADRARAIGADHLSERLPVENKDDELGQLATVFNDMFARLDRQFTRLRQFSGDASHQLRTPLTAIRSVGEVGLREPRDAAAYQEIIASMLEEADRLGRVVETLLTLARWESGRARPTPEDVDLRALTEDVVNQLHVLAEDRRVTIDVALGDGLIAHADALMLRQAITNVVDNAIKFTPEGSRVRIWTESSGPEHHLVVDDEGPGIPSDQRERVLERFYRIHDGRDRGAEGVGLGLAIVHWALTANGGHVAIETNASGGARVRLVVPRAAPAMRS